MFEVEKREDIQLSKEIKKRLLSLVDSIVLIDGEKYSLLNGIDKYTDSLYNSFKKQNTNELIEISLWI